MRHLLLVTLCASSFLVYSATRDTLRFQLHGLIDGYSVLGKKNDLGKVPYLVSSSNINSFQINLNLFELTWENTKWKYALSPAMGSYMTQNYANEKWFKRWIYEAYIQRKWQRSSIALGVFSSPYTQETPKSSDHVSYSRSLAPEYVPYYISGLKYNRTINASWSLSLFAMNGWQKMDFAHFSPSFGSLLEFKRDRWKFNWSTYVGRETNMQAKEPQTRMLSEWNMQFSQGKWLFQSCLFVGSQGINFSRNWGQINAQSAYYVSNRMKLYGRMEYFIDPTNVQVSSTQLASESVGLSYSLNEFMNIGTEFRCFHSEKKAFEPYQFLFFQLKF